MIVIYNEEEFSKLQDSLESLAKDYLRSFKDNIESKCLEIDKVIDKKRKSSKVPIREIFSEVFYDIYKFWYVNGPLLADNLADKFADGLRKQATKFFSSGDDDDDALLEFKFSGIIRTWVIMNFDSKVDELVTTFLTNLNPCITDEFPNVDVEIQQFPLFIPIKSEQSLEDAFYKFWLNFNIPNEFLQELDYIKKYIEDC